MTASILNVVVLLSGNGSNLQALLDYQSQNAHFRIVKVIANRPDAFGLERAKRHNIETALVDHRCFDNRETFEQALIKQIDPVQPGLVVLAGFMRILTPLFTQHYLGRMLNIHPSLLPKYPGLNTHQRALDAGDAYHGLSIHYVTAELDGGPVILQASLPIEIDATAESLQQQVHQLEHQAYPLVVELIAKQHVQLKDNQAWHLQQPLLTPLQLADFKHG
jgi:phosphoribosylglycinamide formyltransferase-1